MNRSMSYWDSELLEEVSLAKQFVHRNTTTDLSSARKTSREYFVRLLTFLLAPSFQFDQQYSTCGFTVVPLRTYTSMFVVRQGQMTQASQRSMRFNPRNIVV